MYKKITRLAAIPLALALLSGCAGNPEPAEAPGTTQAALRETTGQAQTSYTFPEKFTGDWTGQEGKLRIHADAQVVAEQGTVLPTATVTPRDFTQEDVDKLLQVFLKGEPLYAYVQTKQELKDWIDWINSPEWEPDPDVPEQKEQRRKRLNEEYAQWVLTAPEEKPIVHGFSDSSDPREVSGSGTVDGVEYDVSIQNGEGIANCAQIIRKDYKYKRGEKDWGDISREEAIAVGDALMQELGFDNMALDDVRLWWEKDGTWDLYYAPTVNGIHISSICKETTDEAADGGSIYQYEVYSASEETNADPVSWYTEHIRLFVGKEGVLAFYWYAPTDPPELQEAESELLSFDEIAAIADAMLPVVITGPTEARSLVELDKINGFETHMDVEITKVSLTLMRVRDKGSRQGTIVPVWDFWGTSDWYEDDPTSHGMQRGMYLDTEPLLTLNAVDGTVVSRLFGY